jgi:ATP-dependent Lhr-like helicase
VSIARDALDAAVTEKVQKATSPLEGFHPPVRRWFEASFAAPTKAQALGWPSIIGGLSTLLLAPTGSGKTLAAFLTAIDRLMFTPPPDKKSRLRVLYVSPLKALAVDVERNLRAPLAGIAAGGEALHIPVVGIRTGDTPASERARMLRAPPDILITTPESLFLLLTSQARDTLRSVETVIVDEIHSLVPTKRGAHLFLSLERLETVRNNPRPMQRIGLSATQRPLDEVARLLGGGTLVGGRTEEPALPATGGAGAAQHVKKRWKQRPVQIIDAGAKKQLDVRVEVPVEDLAKLGEVEELPSGPAAGGPRRRSIWPSIHPRLLELIKDHRSTMIFVNSRRLAERLAGALNELAGVEVALAHHGSVARDKRQEMEDRLKKGELPAIVATSSLELGIDMGAVDLVVQIEAPPSIASGLQRIGRAGHQVGGLSSGVIFPKHRGDLLSSAAATRGMSLGMVEETFYPRNPLDVLAQQIVAIASNELLKVDELFDLVRRAAPFADLPRSSFEGVLDMLSGRYPSDEFAELRPRLTWDRIAGTLRAREGAGRIAIANAGTIPDRGLYGVFLAGGDGPSGSRRSSTSGGSRRVGELDEEMVFETRVGEVFVLGASSWRVEEITQDKVLVTPAPGEPGKMPFWHGDRPGRPLEFGRQVGQMSRELLRGTREKAMVRLREQHGLDERAARNLLQYLKDQAEVTGEVPSDQTIIVERYVDEVGDHRVCVLTPFGARVHAPWSTAVVKRLEEDRGGGGDEIGRVESMWTDDGMVFRLPESDAPPEPELFFPAADEVEELVTQALGGTSLFAARFRENAGRALLLPRRHPGKRSPLWAQRKRSQDLLQVARRYGSFPLLLETYRECLRDVFDLPGLQELLRQVQDRRIRVLTVDTRVPSPFAASLLFSYVANFIYDGDAPLAERRAQALSVDQTQLRELLGEAELHERFAQRLERKARHADGLHDLLLSLGDLSITEITERCEVDPAPLLKELSTQRRVFPVALAGEQRFIATEDGGRYRDALGIPPPPGLPRELLEPVKDPLGDLVSRWARTHGPFHAEDLAVRWGTGPAIVRAALERLSEADRVLEGEFLPGGRGREWIDAEVLKSLKRRSLARLRKEVEPVEPAALGRFAVEWQGVTRPRRGLDPLLAAVEQLQGAPLPASVLEREILAARIEGLKSADLDVLFSAGELVWTGVEPIGSRDGRVALYLSDHYRLLAPVKREVKSALADELRALLQKCGASFFADLQTATGAFPADLLETMWQLVWAGQITNDTLAPLRSYLRGAQTESGRPQRSLVPGRSFRSRRLGPPGSEGRWSLLPEPQGTPTERAAALSQVLLARYGVLTREAVHAENIPGGFGAVYSVLKAMEEAGRARRGYFVAGLGATQFALPGAEERLRSFRELSEEPLTQVLAATDPANPYGAVLPWPANGRGEANGSDGAIGDGSSGAPGRPQRAAGALVVLHGGELVAWLGRGEHHLHTFLPAQEPGRSHAARALAEALGALVQSGKRKALLISRVDGGDVNASALSSALKAAGFSAGIKGYLRRGPSEPRALTDPRALIDPGGLRLRAPRGMMRGPLGPDLRAHGDGAHLRGAAPDTAADAPPALDEGAGLDADPALEADLDDELDA